MILALFGGILDKVKSVVLPSPVKLSTAVASISNVGKEFAIILPQKTSFDVGAVWNTILLPRSTANPSVNVKVEAIMSFADLTWDDVTKTVFPAFTASVKALQTGKVDAVGAVPSGPGVYELAASKKGIRWLDMPKTNTEAWNKLQNIIPFMHPEVETLGAGLSKDNSVELGGYRYPTLTVYADTSEETVYNFIKAIDLSYELFKNILNFTPVISF